MKQNRRKDNRVMERFASFALLDEILNGQAIPIGHTTKLLFCNVTPGKYPPHRRGGVDYNRSFDGEMIELEYLH